MKNLLSSGCLLMILSLQLYAQENRFYFTAGMSKDFAAGKQVLITNTKVNEVISTYGKGFSFGPAIGYMFSENIGVEIGYTFFNASEIEVNSGDAFSKNNIVVDASMRRIIPALKLTTGNKLKPFAKFGIVLGISPTIDVDIKKTWPGFTYTETNEFKYGKTIGIMSSIGSELALSSVTGLYLELRLINQTWAPEIVYYDAMMSGQGGSVSENGSIIFMDEISSGSLTHQLKRYFSFSSLGINLGVKFNLGRKSIRASEN